MAQKTKSKFLPTLIALGLVAGGLWVLIPDEILSAPGRRSDDRLLILEVSFKPSPRDRAIDIGYVIESGEPVRDWPTTSPWKRKEYLARGKHLVLFANQPTPGELNCSVSEITDAGVVPLIWDTTLGDTAYPYSVVCEVRR